MSVPFNLDSKRVTADVVVVSRFTWYLLLLRRELNLGQELSRSQAPPTLPFELRDYVRHFNFVSFAWSNSSSLAIGISQYMGDPFVDSRPVGLPVLSTHL